MSAVILFHEGLVVDGQKLAAPFDANACGRGFRPDRVGECACLRRDGPDLLDLVYVCGLCPSSLDAAHALADGIGLRPSRTQEAPGGATPHLESCDLFPAWSSVLALGQTAGRGQLGRAWHSGAGNMFAALRLPLAPPFAGSEAAPALGALLAAALRDCGCRVLLKWPNDIVIPDHKGMLRKAGGSLLEERGGSLLAGIGLNVASSPPPDALREDHALPGGCLAFAEGEFSPGVPPAPLDLWLKLVGRMKFWYDQSPDFAARWLPLAEGFLAWRGRQVVITDGPDNVIRGILAGLAPDGGLRVRVGASVHTVHSGSLSLPPPTTCHPRELP
jgi:BirA family biotin operon repressor/biotin-[acetyl-CoA-carboxylase] ligase